MWSDVLFVVKALIVLLHTKMTSLNILYGIATTVVGHSISKINNALFPGERAFIYIVHLS